MPQEMVGFLGWNAFSIYVGSDVFAANPEQLQLDWTPSDIHNCSTTDRASYIGICAAEQGGKHLLALVYLPDRHVRILLRADYLLYHAIDRVGDWICYTRPSGLKGTADLLRYDIANERAELLLEGGVAQDSVPSWYPDSTHIAYHSPDGWVERLDIPERRRERLVGGRAPCISPDGRRVLFVSDNRLMVLDDTGVAEVPLRWGWHRPRLTDSLSWSPNGRAISFATVAGLTDMQTQFYLFAFETNRRKKIRARYLRGLALWDPELSQRRPAPEQPL